MSLLSLCDSKTAFIPIWLEQGFSPCFFYTVVPFIHALVIILCGVAKLHGISRSVSEYRSLGKFKTWLMKLYVMLLVALLLHPSLKLVLEYFFNDHIVYGYQLIYFLAESCSWLIICLIIYAEHKHYTSYSQPKSYTWTLLVPIALSFIIENLTLVSISSKLWFFVDRRTSSNVNLGLFIVKYILTASVFIIVFYAPEKLIHARGEDDNDDDELLQNLDPPSNSSPWKGLRKKLILLWPFLWPRGSPALQGCVLFCVALLIFGRIVNLFLPIYYKKIVVSLTPKNQTSGVMGGGTLEGFEKYFGVEFRLDLILTYMTLWFLQGGGMGSVGFLSCLRSFLWTWVQQYTIRTTEVKLFSHLHSLSLRWHMGRKTGEVLRIVDRGTSSINNLLNYLIFNVVPTIVDIIVAFVFFLTSFDSWFAIIILVTMIVYLAITIVITEWRTKFRKRMNKLDNDMNARAVDSLLNFETVKYYGAEDFEVGRYSEAFRDFQKAEWISNSSSNLLDFLQNVVITGGMLIGCLLSAWYVYRSQLTVGDYILFSAYMLQLCAPINGFGTYYRMIQKSLIDMDNMFDLLDVEQEVKDVENAKNLIVSKGQIEFKDVSFHYRPDKPILRNVSFVVPPGETYALVGPSGAGKSTIIRLLFRFYDVQSGCILIDGQDISKVLQKSLRSFIGVVPQDTVLFNNDIEYNIKYGKVGCDFNEIQEAAKVAEIHDRILSFPDGYKTLVGERGLKLSGGEKQRVAISRTVLKAPTFVLLDEATSALDTQTERQIQTSLSKVCENRTTIIVAHRLSTIIHADQIIVLKDGSIVESGKHEELLKVEDGIYAKMWNQQLTKYDNQENNLPENDAILNQRHIQKDDDRDDILL